MARNFVPGSVQYLSNASAALTALPLTMACWFRTPTLNSTNPFIQITSSSTSASNLWILHTSSSSNVRASSNAGGTYRSANTTTVYSANTWHHACGIFGSNTSRDVFIDGGSKGSNTQSSSVGSVDLTRIGAQERKTILEATADGDIAEAAIWNVALTDAEVAILALGVSPLFVRPGNLAAYWPLIGRTSPEIDLVGGFDMTLNAAPTVSNHPRIYLPNSGFYTPAAAVGAPPSAIIMPGPLLMGMG